MNIFVIILAVLIVAGVVFYVFNKAEAKGQQTLQEQIGTKTDRQLLEDAAYLNIQKEKHLANISSTLNWFFWIFIISLFIYGVFYAMNYNEPAVRISRY